MLNFDRFFRSTEEACYLIFCYARRESQWNLAGCLRPHSHALGSLQPGGLQIDAFRSLQIHSVFINLCSNPLNSILCHLSHTGIVFLWQVEWLESLFTSINHIAHGKRVSLSGCMLLVLEFCRTQNHCNQAKSVVQGMHPTFTDKYKLQTHGRTWENTSQDSSLCRLLLSASDNLAERPGLRLHAALQGMFRQRVIVVYCQRHEWHEQKPATRVNRKHSVVDRDCRVDNSIQCWDALEITSCFFHQYLSGPCVTGAIKAADRLWPMQSGPYIYRFVAWVQSP